MSANNSDTNPQFDSLQELVDFFDHNDISELASQMPEVDFDVDIKRSRYLVSVDGSLMDRLSEAAKSQQMSVELLIDAWLREKLPKAS